MDTQNSSRRYRYLMLLAAACVLGAGLGSPCRGNAQTVSDGSIRTAGNPFHGLALHLPSGDADVRLIHQPGHQPGVMSGPAPSVASNEAPAHREVASRFLTRRGTQLCLNGRPYRFVGWNSYTLTACWDVASDQQLDAFFASLRPNSMTRTWAFENFGIAAIDRLVRAAERHQQMLILTLADGRSHCGDTEGTPDGEEGTGKTPRWYQQGYKYTLLPWIDTVVPRYANSPAIGMWEIINEPDDAGNIHRLRSFFDTVSAKIKSHDPNHLVGSGTWPAWAYGGKEEYRYIHESPNIDAISMHEYDWESNDKQIESGHFQDAVEVMRSLNKPLYIGEVGIPAGPGGDTSVEERVEGFLKKFDAYFGGGAAGVLVWNWTTTPAREFNYGQQPNDPLIDLIYSYSYPGPTHEGWLAD